MRKHKLPFLVILASFTVILFLFSFNSIANALSSNCVVTRVGAPGMVEPPLPDDCPQPAAGGAGGVPGTGAGQVPLYTQCDPRWAYNSYGCGSTMKSAACGPTSLAMVISYHLGREVLPPETAALALSKGWRICGNGTAWAAMTGMPPIYGLKSKSISWAEAKTYLAQGLPIIQSQANGYFTRGGHFIVLTGISPDGKTFYINDPDGFHRTTATEAQIAPTAKAQWYISK
jgi:hypothetical protein